MEDKLRRYVDGLFARTAPTKTTVELKEEMLQNLQDKYDDLMTEGKSPEAAYNIVVASVGDVGDLLKDLETEMPESIDLEEFELARSKSAMRTAVAVMVIILSILPLIVLSIIGSRANVRIGIPVMIAAIAVGTGLLVYNNMTKPRYPGNSNTMVEQFREWQADKYDRKSLRRAISAALWAMIIALYFIISFIIGAWHITWIIFLFAVAIEAFINIFFALKK